jgi:predicted metalloendopeptidase
MIQNSNNYNSLSDNIIETPFSIIKKYKKYFRASVIISSIVILALIIALIFTSNKQIKQCSKCDNNYTDIAYLDDEIKKSILTKINDQIDPCNDFYEYSCSNLQLSKGTQHISIWEDMAKDIQTKQFEILSKHFEFISPYYDECLKTSNEDISNFLTKYLMEINSITDINLFLQKLGDLRQSQMESYVLFSSNIMGDFHYEDQYMLYLLPQEVFLDSSTITKLLLELSFSGKIIENVILLNDNLEKISKSYNTIEEIINDTERMTVSSFKNITNIPITEFLNTFATNVNGNIKNIEKLNIIGLEYFTNMNKILINTDIETLKSYLILNIFIQFPFISNQFGNKNYCLELTINEFSDYFSHKFIIETFPPRDKIYAEKLVDTIYKHMGIRLKDVSWLDEQTREEAINKWAYIQKNIAYVNKWLNYSDIKLTNDFFENFIHINKFQNSLMISKIEETIDRNEMNNDMILNAAYNPTQNSINLYSGLMRKPIFSPNLPFILNLAAYGSVIGHEITHGFDNNGRMFGKNGSYNNWWTNKSETEFTEHTQCLVDQYNEYTFCEMFPNDKNCDIKMNVNGEHTLGENIADLGGVNLAFNSYKEYETKYVQKEDILPGYSNDKLFFIYFAQVWCEKQTINYAIQSNSFKNEHSPNKFRVNGVVSNMPEFANAFQCSNTSKMGKSLTNERCEVW